MVQPVLSVVVSDSACAVCRCQWFSLSEVKSGRIHLVLEWLPRLSDPGCLDQVSISEVHLTHFFSMLSVCLCDNVNLLCTQVLSYQTQQSYQNRVVPSAALLFIYLEAAHSLPVSMHMYTCELPVSYLCVHH